MKIRELAALALLCPAACTGSGKVLTAHGPTVRESDAMDSQYRRFAALWDSAMLAASQQPESAERIDRNAALLRGGFSVIYNDCSDAFGKRGVLQQRLSFFRDATGAIVPVVTGALGLVSGAGSAIAAIGVAGGAANAGIGVVAQDFLFGADNIEDVRVLTLNALAAHQSTVTDLRSKHPTDATFDWVANQIMDDQAICEGPHILALSKQAIAKGNVKTYTTATVTTASEPDRRDNGGFDTRKVLPDLRRFSAGRPESGQQPTTAAQTLPTRVGVRIEN